MKKLSLLLVLILTATMLFACNNTDTDSDTDYTDANGIAWSDTVADPDLVGAWQLEDETNTEYYIFTEDCKIKIARGNVYFQGDVTYGIDTSGNHQYFSEFYYMYGQLSYTVDGDTATFINADGTVQVFNKAEFKEPELKVYEDFNAENPLVGTWANEEYNDSYTFGSDGTASYSCQITDYACYAHSEYVYKVADGSLHLTYDAGDGVQEVVSEYTITGDTISIDGAEYTRQ